METQAAETGVPLCVLSKLTKASGSIRPMSLMLITFSVEEASARAHNGDVGRRPGEATWFSCFLSAVSSVIAREGTQVSDRDPVKKLGAHASRSREA